MPAPQDTLDRIDEAMARFDQALEAIRQIPKVGGHAATIDGIEHEFAALAWRLRALRNIVGKQGRCPWWASRPAVSSTAC
jgi:hypothetical protein